MEWTIIKADRTSKDPSGVDGFIQRMDQELRAGGSPIEGFRILESGLEMLWITREIENEVLQNPEENNRLYVGFQNSTKLNIENRRYEMLKKAGIDVVGFGEGGTSEENSKNLEQWVALPRNTSAFENQWYLITTGPSPIVFIGWETSDPEKFGRSLTWENTLVNGPHLTYQNARLPLPEAKVLTTKKPFPKT